MTGHLVLVVEDDADIREALMDSLRESGCEVAGASNGVAALRYLATAQPLPCLILLDLMMPVMDGRAFRETQLQDPRIAHIPVVVLSAYRDVQASAEKLGAAAVLRKPPEMADVMSAIAHHC